MSTQKQPSRSNEPFENVVLVRANDSENEIINIGPLRLEVLEDGRNTDNRMSATYITVPPHTPGPPQHWHQMHDETFLIIRGTCTFTSRKSKIVCKAGDYMVVPTNSPHTFANDSDEELLMYTTYSPGYYINYFRLMAEMAKNASNGSNDLVTPSMVKRAMGNFATLQTKPGYDWDKGDGREVARDLNY